MDIYGGSTANQAINDDQKIYIVPSKKLVVIRLGEAAENVDFALSSFDNNLWEKINLVIN
jgi:hypothetical protein